MDAEHLTPEQRASLGEHMRAQLLALASEITTLVAFTAPVAPDPAIGRLSRLEAMNEKAVNEAALRSARTREGLIRAALARLDEDDFGLCDRCDEPIPFLRLKSVPGTRLCVACAQKSQG